MDKAAIFDENYQGYLDQLATVDLAAVKEPLGLIPDSGKLWLPFFNKRYIVENSGLTDEAGRKPSYGEAVILFKYILLCPERPYADPAWAAFKDFKKASHFTNVNFFRSDTEGVIESAFSGRVDDLRRACTNLGGFPAAPEMPYDVTMQFDALPRISLLLLFNDADEEFPAKGTVLFQKHAEYYLDPESLVMTSAWLARNLAKQVK